MAEAGEGRGGKRGGAEAGPIRVQLLAAAGLLLPALRRIRWLLFFFLDWKLFGELRMRSGDRSVLSVRAFILKLI